MNRFQFLASCLLNLAALSSVAQASTVVCTAKDVFSGRAFSEGGANYVEAREAAVDECQSKTGETCVVQCASSEAAQGFTAGRGYYCNISDRIGRSWVGRGSNMFEAREEAHQECAADAGVECQIASCGTLQ